MEASTVTNFKNLLLCSTTTSDGEINKNLAAGFDLFPDEILIVIVSKLTTLKEAVRTSVISKRWRYLWRFTSGTLDFDGGFDGKLESVENFNNWVNHILELHQSPSIENFKLRMPPIWCLIQCPFYEWISFAMLREVVSLDFGWREIHFDKLTLEKLLHMCREVRPETLFCRLTSLKLVNANVDAKLIEYFISNAPLIENVAVEAANFLAEKLAIVSSSLKSLVLHNCNVLRILKVFCSSLKSLDISGCCNLKFLEIGSENLVSLRYHGRRFKPKRFQMDVCLLSELEIGKDFCKTFICEPDELLLYSEWLINIEKLKMCASIEDFGRVLPAAPSFSDSSMPLLNLKQLELQIVVPDGHNNLIILPALLKGCPFLSKLVIEISFKWIYGVKDTYGTGDYKSETGKGAGFENEGLKVVEIVKFYGMRMDFVLALHILELAPRLEKMVIHPHTSPGVTLSMVRSRARRLVADVLPSVELVIL